MRYCPARCSAWTLDDGGLLSRGILTVLVFYFFHGRKWWCYAVQILCLWYINFELLGGLVYEFVLFGVPFTFPQQGFALLALPLLWLYHGKQGYHSKAFQYFCYASIRSIC